MKIVVAALSVIPEVPVLVPVLDAIVQCSWEPNRYSTDFTCRFFGAENFCNQFQVYPLNFSSLFRGILKKLISYNFRGRLRR